MAFGDKTHDMDGDRYGEFREFKGKMTEAVDRLTSAVDKLAEVIEKVRESNFQQGMRIAAIGGTSGAILAIAISLIAYFIQGGKL